MSPSTWSVQDWLIILTLFLSGVTFVIGTMGKVINSLLKEKWDGHERRISGLEDRMDDQETEITNLRIDVRGLEKTCDIRHDRGGA